MRFVGRFFVAVLVGIGLTNVGAGCGAMFNDTHKVVPVRVNPPGARIYLDGLHVAQAPGAISVTNGQSHTVDIDADGFERQSTRIEAKASAGFIVLDCLLLVLFIVPGIIALAVDAGTDGWKTANVDYINVGLRPLPPTSWPSAPTVVQPTAVPASSGSAQPVPTGCQYDTQCKESRICRNFQCVDPGAP